MIVYIKGNHLPLNTDLTLEVLHALRHLHIRGDINVAIHVYLSERVGYIPIEDLDFVRLPTQLALSLETS